MLNLDPQQCTFTGDHLHYMLGVDVLLSTSNVFCISCVGYPRSYSSDRTAQDQQERCVSRSCSILLLSLLGRHSTSTAHLCSPVDCTCPAALDMICASGTEDQGLPFQPLQEKLASAAVVKRTTTDVVAHLFHCT